MQCRQVCHKQLSDCDVALVSQPRGRSRLSASYRNPDRQRIADYSSSCLSFLFGSPQSRRSVIGLATTP